MVHIDRVLLALVALSCHAGALSAVGSTSMLVNQYDVILAGGHIKYFIADAVTLGVLGASFIPGHGAPTGLSLRTGSPGMHFTPVIP